MLEFIDEYGPATKVYTVWLNEKELAAYHNKMITDTDIITAVDNNTHDATNPGKMHHFGGKVTHLEDNKYRVYVYID